MSIKLGNTVKNKLTDFIGTVYTHETHLYGCERLDIMPHGCESPDDAMNCSLTVVEKLGDGIVEEVNNAIKPRFKLGKKVRTINGCEGAITVIVKCITGRVYYVLQEPSEDGKTLKDGITVDENLIKEYL